MMGANSKLGSQSVPSMEIRKSMTVATRDRGFKSLLLTRSSYPLELARPG